MSGSRHLLAADDDDDDDDVPRHGSEMVELGRPASTDDGSSGDGGDGGTGDADALLTPSTGNGVGGGGGGGGDSGAMVHAIVHAANRSLRSRAALMAGPLVALPFLAFDILEPGKPAVSRCFGITLWMVAWWLLEVFPMPVTALLPLVLFPVFGVTTAARVSGAFFNEFSWLFIGTFFLAAAVEKWNLHKRIALRVLVAVEDRPAYVLLGGFMALSMTLSMFLTNVATTAMLTPIAVHMMEHVTGGDGEGDDEGEGSGGEGGEGGGGDDDDDGARDRLPGISSSSSGGRGGGGDDGGARERFQRGLLLGIAYASSVGGSTTLTGTGPNLMFSGVFATLFPDAPPVSYAAWLAFAWPIGALLVIAMFATLALVFARGYRGRSEPAYVARRYAALGPVSREERVIIAVFAATTLAWMTRNLPGDTGWAAAFRGYGGRFAGFADCDASARRWKSYVADSTIAVAAALVLFMLPTSQAWRGRCAARLLRSRGRSGERDALLGHDDHRSSSNSSSSSSSSGGGGGGGEADGGVGRGDDQASLDDATMSLHPRDLSILDWDHAAAAMPWGILYLLGGGFALAAGFADSGMSAFLGGVLGNAVGSGARSPYGTLVTISMLVTMWTEVTSNSATAAVVLPILGSLAVDLDWNPLFLMVPAAIACSLAFMSPIATPPNAIVYTAGHMRLRDMIRVGIVLNVMGVAAVTLGMRALGGPILGVWDATERPAWATFEDKT